MSDGHSNIQSVERAFLVLHEIAEWQDTRGPTLTEITNTLGLSTSTTHRFLRTLHTLGCVEHDRETGRYSLGITLLELGCRALVNQPLPAVASPHLNDLMMQTQETVYLSVLDRDNNVVYLDKVDSPQPVRMDTHVGWRFPAHSTAAGKAILAHIPESRLAQIVNSGLPALTPNTLADEAALRAELAKIRANGYAIDNMENREDIVCVGAPLFDHAGNVVGAISASAPAIRLPLDKAQETGPLVAETAREISRGLGYRSPERQQA